MMDEVFRPIQDFWNDYISLQEQEAQPEEGTSVSHELEAPSSSVGRPGTRPNIMDAYAYIEAVRTRFARQKDVYPTFVNILDDFKDNKTSVEETALRICIVFAGHQDLLDGFNMFLPPGYRIQTVAGSRGAKLIAPSQATVDHLLAYQTDLGDVVYPATELTGTNQAAP